MRRHLLGFAAGLVALSMGTAAAQHKGSGSGSGSGPGSGSNPYADFAKRRVAAFSDEDAAGIVAGRGMGFALPAELNGYPGPLHILELAAELGLTHEQRAAVEALIGPMQARAKEAGRRYVEAEQALDAAFRSQAADAATIERLVRAADSARAEKRLAHLLTHIEARRLLTKEQLAIYAARRGYATR